MYKRTLGFSGRKYPPPALSSLSGSAASPYFIDILPVYKAFSDNH